MKHLLIYLSSVTTLIPFIAAVSRKQTVTAANVFIYAFVTASAIAETLGTLLFALKANNIWLSYVFTPVELILLALALFTYHTNKPHRYIIITLLLLIVAAQVVDIFFLDGFIQFNSFSRSVESLLLIALSLYSFYHLIQNPQALYIQQLPLFWLALAVLLYAAGNLFLFAVKNIALHHPVLNTHRIWVLHSLLNIIFNALVTKSILCIPRAHKSR